MDAPESLEGQANARVLGEGPVLARINHVRVREKVEGLCLLVVAIDLHGDSRGRWGVPSQNSPSKLTLCSGRACRQFFSKYSPASTWPQPSAILLWPWHTPCFPAVVGRQVCNVLVGDVQHLEPAHVGLLVLRIGQAD